VAQDIMVHVTGIPMPKQVGLALHILKQTGSKTLVTRQIAFSHEWTDYPSSLFEVDPRLVQGFVMRKGNKSDFLAVLIAEAEQDVVLHLPSLPQSDLSTVYLEDTIAFVNKYQKNGCKNIW